MSENEKNIPKRRFKEFENAEAWEVCKLRDILSLENGFAFKSKFFQEENSTTIVLTPGNVAVGGGFQNDKGRYYNVAGIFPKQFIFNPGDIFVTMTDLTPSAQTLGFPAIVPNDGIEYLHNQRLGKIVSYNYNNLFSFYLLCTENYHNYIVSTASGTTVKHTSPERILDYNCYIPQKDEQSKIASCFRRIDNLITLHQRKLDKIKALKKAYLTDMFPAKGECKPKLRFAGFTDDWEQRKLGEVATIRTGYPFDSNDFDDKGEYLVITNGNIQNDSPTVDSSLGSRINFNNAILSEYMLNPNDILVTMDGTVGRTAKVVEQKQILAQRVGRLTAKSDPEFLYQVLNTGEFFKKMTLISHGGTIKHISLNEISSYISCMPSSSEERTKIGIFFRNTDNLITLHQHKLDKLQDIKKAYLKEMFI